MATMDIFNANAFSMVSLTQFLNKVDYLPSLLGSLEIFEPMPTRTPTIMIEKRESGLSIIQTSERGAPLEARENDKRDIRPFATRRIAKGDTIQASEILGIRADGSETELQNVANEVERRYNGPAGILRDVDMTWENMRLGAVQGIVLDADGATLDNWYTNWGIAQAAEIDFELDDTATNVRLKCQTVTRTMAKASKGAWIMGATEVHALCGDTFYDHLTNHASVVASYTGWASAAELRQNIAYSAFTFSGITFHNYRGADSFAAQGQAGKAGMGIDAEKAKFFPVRAPGVFKMAYAPGEAFSHLQMAPQMLYGLVVRDLQRDFWVRPEAYSYPLFVCTRPEMLQRAKDH